jgi:hypothetical protein
LQFDNFENEISQKCSDNKYVFLSGDFNARTGTLKDFICSDPHLNDLFDIDNELQQQFDKYSILENLSIPLQRVSMDNKTNMHGFRLIDLCKNNNLFILNGRLSSDKSKGTFTFRNKSVIDYVIASADCFKNIQHFEVIETDPIFSDGHSSLSWTFNIKPPKSQKPKTKPYTKRPKWKEGHENRFRENINITDIYELETQLNTYPQSQNTLEHITGELQSIFQFSHPNISCK